MKSLLSLAFLLMFSAGLVAQTVITDNNAQARNVGEFKGISVSAGIELLLSQGDKDAVAVSSNKTEYLDRVKTSVENGMLKIYIDNPFGSDWRWRKGVKFKAYVSARQLTQLKASSGATVKIGGAFKVADLALDASSGGKIEGEFIGRQISSENSSGAITEISGSAESLTVDASSGAIFKGYEFHTVNCSAEASSGAVIRVFVTKDLKASASSGGAITYKGGGSIRDIKTGSGGSVRSSGR